LTRKSLAGFNPRNDTTNAEINRNQIPAHWRIPRLPVYAVRRMIGYSRFDGQLILQACRQPTANQAKVAAWTDVVRC
jgi:hypothetical protein